MTSRLRRFVSAKIGACPKCFRAALLGAVAGWLALPVAFTTLPSPWRLLVIAWPLAFSVLWLLHIVTFAGRSLSRSARRPQPEGARLDRRRALLAFSSALAVGISASLPATAATDCGRCEQYSGKQHDDCCLCRYNNCTDACGNDNSCINRCYKIYQSC